MGHDEEGFGVVGEGAVAEDHPGAAGVAAAVRERRDGDLDGNHGVREGVGMPAEADRRVAVVAAGGVVVEERDLGDQLPIAVPGEGGARAAVRVGVLGKLGADGQPAAESGRVGDRARDLAGRRVDDLLQRDPDAVGFAADHQATPPSAPRSPRAAGVDSIGRTGGSSVASR